jgi:hypothetical protein
VDAVRTLITGAGLCDDDRRHKLAADTRAHLELDNDCLRHMASMGMSALLIEQSDSVVRPRPRESMNAASRSSSYGGMTCLIGRLAVHLTESLTRAATISRGAEVQ